MLNLSQPLKGSNKLNIILNLLKG